MVRLQRRERRRQVLGRVGLAERAADRPPVAHDGVGDHLLRVVQDREMLARRGRVEQLRVPGQRADPQLAAVDLDIGQLAEPVDVDQGLRLRQPQLHHRDQAVPAGQDPRLGAEPGEQASACSTLVAFSYSTYAGTCMRPSLDAGTRDAVYERRTPRSAHRQRSGIMGELAVMTLTQLNAFVLVARLGSVTAAANALGVSEPAVSQALSLSGSTWVTSCSPAARRG